MNGFYKPHVLVTGGAGYIGSHACKSLSCAGVTPVAFDNLSFGHAHAVKWGPLEEGDLLDCKRIQQVLEKYRPIGIMHFAASTYVGESVKDPCKYYQNNVIGSFNLLEEVRRHAIPFIFSSSCATYGNPIHIPIDESHPQQPLNPYGHSKLMVEQMLADACHAYKLPYAALRYFNASGADLDNEIGEDHTPETHLIPLAIQTALGLRPSFEIFGTDYDTPDGTAVRDYIHVTDLAVAHVKALSYLLEGAPSVCLNLGTGRGYSVKEIVSAVEKVSGCIISKKIGPRREGDATMLVANAKKSQELLNWIPQHSDLKTIVETAWKWHLSQQGVMR